MIKAISLLLKITLIGLSYLLSVNGWKYIFSGIVCITVSTDRKIHKYCFNQLYALDIAVCSELFGTRFRTISGMVGQRSHIKPYSYWSRVERFIDWLAVLFGDKPKHCFRAFRWEAQHLTFS